MSGTIEQRVVQMEFDNKAFGNGIKETLDSLTALNKGLKLDGATKGLNDVSAAASKFSLAGLSSGVENIASKFQTMSVIAISAIASIVSKAVTAGISVAKAFTIDPIKAGFENYETQINAVQTILANTSQEGTKLADVNKVLAVLNTYANQTVYNFGQMVQSIGTFTAAGVDLKTSASAIKGIANLAAISGSTSEQASTAMYQLSQAIAAGTVKLQDWNSVVNAGLGGKTFQTALINTARASGVAIDSIIKKNGSFRNSLQEGWLTSGILTKTLAQFTGDLSEAQIKAMGFTDAEAKHIMELGKTAVNAATQIKTYTQLTQALKEEVATAYGAVFKTIFGNITEATTLFSSVHTVLENALTAPIYSLNTLLQGVDKLGGRKNAIDAIKNVFHAFGAVLKPIGAAFHEIFPPATAKDINNIITAIDNFTKKLKIGATTSGEIKRTFAGLFAVLDIGRTIIVDVVKMLVGLFSTAGNGSGGILKSTASIGDFLVAVDKAVKSGAGLTKFFQELGRYLAVPIKLISQLDTYIGHLFDKFDANKAAKITTTIAGDLDPLQLLGKTISEVWSHVIKVLDDVWGVFEPVAKKLGAFFSGFGQMVAGAFDGINYQTVLATINTGLFAGLILLLKKFVNKFKGESEGIGGGILDSLKETVEGLTGTLKQMQNTLKAATLLEIAAALAILTISVVALSKIDSQGLTRALSAMAVMFAQLGASLYLLEKGMTDAKLLKLYLITGALSGLAVAIDLLTISVLALSRLSWSELEKGLSGVTGLLIGLIATVKLMPNPAGLILSAAGLTILAVAIRLLALSVTALDGLSWTEMAKGLTGVAGLLVSLALFTKLSDANGIGVFSGAGIVLLATGILILTKAVAAFSKLSWKEIGKGLTALAGSLLIVTTALDLIPPTAPLGAAGVLILAISLSKVAAVLKTMGDMSWKEIGRGLTAMAGVLVLISAALDVISPTAPLSAAGVLIVAIALGKIANILDQFAKMSWGDIGKAMTVLAGSLILISGAMLAMTGALPGAAALLIVSASLAVLAPILMLFGTMSWGSIIKGLTALAAIFAIIGVAGLLLAPVVPVLLGLGLAITLFGVGVALAGVGTLAFAAGLTALSIAGAAGAVALVAIVSALLGLLPLVAKEIGLALIAFANVIAQAGPAIVGAITAVLLALINAIVKLSPSIVKLFDVLVTDLLQVLVDNTPKLIDAGYKLLLAVLNGIANHIGQVVTAATNIIVNFLNGITKNQPRVLQAAATMIIGFVQGLADTINNNTSKMDKAGANLAKAIINGMTGGLLGGLSKVTDAATNVAKSALNAAKNFLGINSPSKEFHKIGMGTNEGFANGIEASSSLVTRATENVGRDAMTSLKKSISGVADILAGEIDVTPTIRPVLDLTDVKKTATQLGGIFTPTPIPVGTSKIIANGVAARYQSNQDDISENAPAGNNSLTFNQYNNSPKALSPSEVYRRTKNQLSVVKEALPV